MNATAKLCAGIGLATATLTASLLCGHAWSQSEPRGRIVFGRYERFGDDGVEIYVMNADGTDQRRLTHDMENASVSSARPVWSPDGQQIAWCSERDGNADIYVMDADGEDQRNLTRNPSSDLHATWSPDGRRVAFISNRDGDYDLWVMDDDGGNQRRLAGDPGGISHPAWSPNGNWFAFTSHDPDRRQDKALWVMDADGGNQRKLTDNKQRNQFPDWTPDSRHILFSSDMRGSQEVFAISVDGRNLRNVTANAAIDQSPGVSPDGLFVAFTSDRDGGTSQIWVTNMNGGSPRNLSNGAGVGDYFPDWTARVSTLTVSPAGRTVITWGWIKGSTTARGRWESVAHVRALWTERPFRTTGIPPVSASTGADAASALVGFRSYAAL